MDLEMQAKYLQILEDNFKGMKNMMDDIKEKITQYPVYTQLEFIKPLKEVIFMAWEDANDDDNEFLNNYDGGDTIEISSDK